MTTLTRIHQPQKDRINIKVITITEALQLLNKKESDIRQRVKWLQFEDIFFHGTKNYIRIIKN